MRVLMFGTYDTGLHPRIGTIAEGLREHGVEVDECNAPLGLDTAARVRLLTQTWVLSALGERGGHPPSRRGPGRGGGVAPRAGAAPGPAGGAGEPVGEPGLARAGLA